MLPGPPPPDEEGEEVYPDDDVPDPDTMSYEELSALGEAVGTVSRGISAHDIALLPVKRYSQAAVRADEQ